MAPAALKGEKTIAQLADQFGVQITQIGDWKEQLPSGATDLFEQGARSKPTAPEIDIKSLHAKNWRADLGELFFRKCAQQGRIAARKAMIDHAHDLPLSSQASCLNISRGSIDYEPAATSPEDLILMRRMDELHLSGSRS